MNSCSRASFLSLMAGLLVPPALALADDTNPASVTLPPRKVPPIIFIKADDLRKKGANVDARWQRFADFIQSRKIKASIGIICDSLEGDSAGYVSWIKEQHDTGLIEFWNHGYDHKEWEENGKKLQEFSGTPYDHQKQHLAQSNQLLKDKLGFGYQTFGAPFNATDAITVQVLKETPDTQVWLYGDLKNPAGKVVLDRIGKVNIENPIFHPSLDKFVEGYAQYPNREFFLIQGHAAQWDEPRFQQFVQIVDFLTKQGAVFMTPLEYARQKGALPPEK